VLRQLPTDPVGIPGLVALAIGFAVFLAALIAARRRAAAGAAEVVARKAPISRLWIVVQALGVAIAAFGQIRAVLDPGSPRAIGEAIVVLALMLGTAALFGAASRAMGQNWALVARTRSDHTLVQDGPFAHVRHPIYVALFLFMVAIAVAYGHTRNLILAVPFFALGTWLRVMNEERLLRAQFGPDYDAYAARVKRFIPGLI
jgi:protein-S-isoprenylcysteine O-methyltransferase Ste14